MVVCLVALESASMVQWLADNVDIPTAGGTHVNRVALLILDIPLQLHKSLNGNP